MDDSTFDSHSDDGSSDDAVEVADADELRELLAEMVHQVTGRVPVVDDDDDLAFRHNGTPVYVTVVDEPLSIRIWSEVVRGVHSRQAAAIETAVRNRNAEWTSWLVVEDVLRQRTSIVAEPFVPRHTEFLLRVFLQELAYTQSDLRLRLGRDS